MLFLGQQVAAKWKSLCDPYVCCKNSSKGKCGDGLEKKPKWNLFSSNDLGCNTGKMKVCLYFITYECV